MLKRVNRGCNTGFIVTKDGIVMVDTLYTCRRQKMAWRDCQIRWGSVYYWRRAPPRPRVRKLLVGGTIIAHDGTRQAIMNAKPEDIINMLKRMAPDQLPLDPRIQISAAWYHNFGENDFLFGEPYLPSYRATRTFPLPGSSIYSWRKSCLYLR